MVSLSVGFSILVSVTLAASVGLLRVLDRSDRRWGDVARARFVMGVPWGTMVVIAVIVGTYLFVQDGITDWYDPVTIPYRAWSYLYPLGMLTASFTHDSPSHLMGNLFGVLVTAPIAEYAWGHYTSARGTESFSSWYRNPWIRALVVFPLVVLSIGIVTSLFALGPVIGFSGVVFAFAGFAIVRYPIATLVAATSVQGTLYTIYQAMGNPIFEYTAQSSPPTAPQWAAIAIQGHALGFFLGFCFALVVFRKRRIQQQPIRLWVALFLFAFAKSLWQIYWFRGSNTYVLYRGIGVIVVTALAIVLTLAIAGSDRPLVPSRLGRRDDSSADDVRWSTERILELVRAIPGATGRSSAVSLSLRDRSTSGRPDARIRELASGTDDDGPSGRSIRSLVARPLWTVLSTATRRETAVVVVVAVLAAMMGPAIPFNAFVLDDDGQTVGANAITVEDYSITYAENVENELISVIDVEAFGEDTSVETGGVIVSSADRNIWTDAISTEQLAFYGASSVSVGGPGWRQSVTAIRQGWTATGGGTAYQIWLRPSGEAPQHVFASDPVRSDVRLAGHNVSVIPAEGAFFLLVDGGPGEGSSYVSLPRDGETVEVNDITFERDGRAVYAESGDTRVQVASRERYH